MVQYITRKTRFDSGHRVINQGSKCRFFHAHSNGCELTYRFDEAAMLELGYPIDFKEIKRVHCAWLDDHFDHGFIANPKDSGIIELCKAENSRLWIMSLEGEEFCNPTCENISKEIFLAIDILTREFYPHLTLHNVRVYETPNCYVDCVSTSCTPQQKYNFELKNYQDIYNYGKAKGVLQYDVTKGGHIQD